MPKKRVVSLIASATETVCALGRGDWLVGRSHECDYPDSIIHLPSCTEPKFPVEGTSYEIDARIKAILQEGLAVYRVHADELDALQPDLILTQSQCDVCAVSLKDVEEAVYKMISSQPTVLSLESNSLAEVWRDIKRVANSLDMPKQGDELVARLENRIKNISQKTKTLPERPAVACIEWIDPLMAAGNWVPELVEMAGGKNLFGEAGKHSPWMNWEQLVASDPDILVILPCGWDMARARAEMPTLTSKLEWAGLNAVKTNRVYMTDGNKYFNRPGPRLVESLEILAEMFHPQHFDYGHKGNAWARY